MRHINAMVMAFSLALIANQIKDNHPFKDFDYSPNAIACGGFFCIHSLFHFSIRRHSGARQTFFHKAGPHIFTFFVDEVTTETDH